MSSTTCIACALNVQAFELRSIDYLGTAHRAALAAAAAAEHAGCSIARPEGLVTFADGSRYAGRA